METFIKDLVLRPETAEALDYLRQHPEENRLHGCTPQQCEQAFREVCLPLLEGASLPPAIIDQYRWFLRELSRHFRVRRGNELCFHVELTMTKWLNLGLETRTMQFLVCEVLLRLKAEEAGDAA